MEISPKMQHQLAQFEQLRQQIQLIVNQRLNLEAKLKELENALEEIDKLSEDTPIYRSIGSIMVKAASKTDMIDKLKEEKETTEIRVKTVQKQEEQLKSRYDDLQTKLSESLKQYQNPAIS
ncbi:MAG: prefoldin subunit beta [Thermoplasmata archaeon]|nr:MAG: prefoldin subunit beta [Thermoplasmata archaeon]